MAGYQQVEANDMTTHSEKDHRPQATGYHHCRQSFIVIMGVLVTLLSMDMYDECDPDGWIHHLLLQRFIFPP